MKPARKLAMVQPGITARPVGRPRNAPTFAVEKGVPIPEPKHAYPFAEMEVGDSFFVPCASKCDRQQLQTNVASRAASFRAKQCPRGREYFSTRVVEGGLRCWRVQ